MKNFKRNWIIFLVICAVIIGYPFFAIKYFESFTLNQFILKHLLVPILIGSFVYSYKFYQRTLRFFKRKNTDPIKIFLEDFFSIFLFGLMISGIVYGIVFSMTITINTYFGNQQKVLIKERVLGYYEEVNKQGKLRRHIEITDPKKIHAIRLQAYKTYRIGDTFEKEMFYGCFGILYSIK